MKPEIQFAVFQALVIVPFLTGLLLKRRVSGRVWADRIVRINLVFLEPPVILWSIWGQDLRSGYAFLPLAGLSIVAVGFAAGKSVLPFLGLRDNRAKTFTISSSLANHGFTMGGFICYLFFGEKGLALASLFILYFMPYTFLFIFGYARGGIVGGGWRSLASLLISPRNMPLYASLAALFFHAAGIPRPAVDLLLDPLVMSVIAFYYLALGLNFEASDVVSNAKGHAVLALIKFAFVPLCAAGLCLLFPIYGVSSSVVMIQSFMPAAIYSVVASLLFGLDSRFATSLFTVNTGLFLALVLPALFLARAAGIF